MEKFKSKIQAVKKEKLDPVKPFLPALFFVAGFLYDVFTLGRVDSWFNIVQQIFFIFVCVFITYLGLLNIGAAESGSHRLVKKAMEYNNEALHFLIGSLLSAFTLFYVKSASSFASFIFIFILFAVLIFNEKSANQSNKVNFEIKWGLISLCILSFLSYSVPMVVGAVGFWITMLTGLIYVLVIGAIILGLIRLGAQKDKIIKLIGMPSGVVLAFIMFCNLMNWTPPIPISIQHIGIYHNVEKKDGQYLLYHQRPWWKFWLHSDQDFKSAPGDKLYGYARIFSPVGFDDKVFFHWRKKDKKGNWVTIDRIPVLIRGGREEGFRAFTFKSNYSSGSYILKVETDDGREIGRSSFFVTKIEPSEDARIFKITYE